MCHVVSSLVACSHLRNAAFVVLMFFRIETLALQYSERRPSYAITMKGTQWGHHSAAWHC